MVTKEEQNSLTSFQFEARLTQASLIKKILEAIKDLVTDANFDCSAEGLSLQVLVTAPFLDELRHLCFRLWILLMSP